MSVVDFKVHLIRVKFYFFSNHVFWNWWEKNKQEDVKRQTNKITLWNVSQNNDIFVHYINYVSRLCTWKLLICHYNILADFQTAIFNYLYWYWQMYQFWWNSDFSLSCFKKYFTYMCLCIIFPQYTIMQLSQETNSFVDWKQSLSLKTH
jgi:hypothetical protein